MQLEAFLQKNSLQTHKEHPVDVHSTGVCTELLLQCYCNIPEEYNLDQMEL